MKGFIYKDLCLLKNVWKTYAWIFAVFAVLTLTEVYDVSFLFSLAAVLLSTYPANTFAYDELAKWDRFASSAPGGRWKVVRGKYLFALLLAGIALATELILALVMTVMGKAVLTEVVLFGLAGGAASLLINAILLPCLFRFGAQKGRVISMAVAAALVAALTACGIVMGDVLGDNDQWLTVLLAGLIAAALIVLPISYKISLGIYQKKEF